MSTVTSRLKSHLSPRKKRLAACAVCRCFWSWLDDDEKRFVERAEDLADSRAPQSFYVQLFIEIERQRRQRALLPRFGSMVQALACSTPSMALTRASQYARWWHGFGTHRFDSIIAASVGTLCDWQPRFETALARDLATGIYETRDPSSAPILADALEDAGFDDETTLARYRATHPVFRGCWVLDKLTGRA